MTFELSTALRRLRRSYAFAGIIVFSMAIGIGSATAIFTAAKFLLWTKPPYPEPDRLVMLEERGPERRNAGISLQDFLDLREQTKSFVHSAAFRLRSFGLSEVNATSKPAVIQVGLVTSELFSTLGIDFARGRGFTEEEERSESPVIVLSHELARPIGATVLLNDSPRTVVGVLPQGFRFPVAPGLLPGTGAGGTPQAYIPISHRDYGGQHKRAVRTLSAVARLSADADLDEARVEIDSIARRLASSYPETNRGFGAELVPLEEVLASPNRRPLTLLGLGTLALVALVAFNVGGLLLARLAGRGREIAVRISLGAGSRDLFGLVFTEVFLATAGGAALGLIGARLALLASMPTLLHLLGGFSSTKLVLGPEAIAFSALLTMATALVLATLVVQLGLRGNPQSSLRTGSLAGPSFAGARRGVVVAQVALAVLLLQCAALLGRSLLRLSSVDPGFTSEGAYAFGLGLPEARYDSDEKMLRFHRRLEETLASIPRVTAVGAAAGAQLSRGISLRMRFRFEGSSLEKLEWPRVSARLVSPGYLEALGAPLVRGRSLTWEDGAARTPVVLVNQAFERSFDGGRDPIGKRIEISWDEGTLYEIVGIVGDVRQLDLRRPAEPEIVLPFARFPPDGAVYVVRTTRRDAGLGEAVRAAVDRLDGRLENVHIRPLSTWIEDSLTRERLSAGLASFLSSTAMALAALGIYGILALSVLERRREIALRIALGASQRAVRSLLWGDALRLALPGVVLGGLGFSLVYPLLRSLIFELAPTDLPALAATLAVLLLAGVVAAWVPSSRAAHTDPVAGLRME